MVEMFWSCTTKEDITAVSSVTAAFQVFSICALGVFMLFMPQKKHSIAIIMNIFIWDLIRDNKTVIWFITCHFLKMHTVLTFIRGIIVYSILPYLFFSCVISLSFAFWELRYIFQKDFFHGRQVEMYTFVCLIKLSRIRTKSLFSVRFFYYS